MAAFAALMVASLTLSACSTDSEDDVTPEPTATEVVVNGIAYRLESRVAETFPVTLYADLTMENVADQAVEVTFPDACVLLLRAYRSDDRTAEPAWDQQRGAMCAQALVRHRLSPGETEQHGTRVDAGEILGDSLPDGRYYLTAFIRPDGREVEIDAGSVELAVR